MQILQKNAGKRNAAGGAADNHGGLRSFFITGAWLCAKSHAASVGHVKSLLLQWHSCRANFSHPLYATTPAKAPVGLKQAAATFAGVVFDGIKHQPQSHRDTEEKQGVENDVSPRAATVRERNSPAGRNFPAERNFPVGRVSRPPCQKAVFRIPTSRDCEGAELSAGVGVSPAMKNHSGGVGVSPAMTTNVNSFKTCAHLVETAKPSRHHQNPSFTAKEGIAR